MFTRRYEYLEEINEGVVRQIPDNYSKNELSILDVGCGYGALAEAMKNQGYKVVGIEANAEAYAIASRRINQVIYADLTSIVEVQRAVGKRSFDYVIFSDVIEHLCDPYTIIVEYKKFLHDKSKMIISVPNIAV